MQIKQKAKLKMVLPGELPERVYNKETKVWDKTGKMVNSYKYYFVTDSLVPETFIITSTKDFSASEGLVGDMLLSVTQKEFQGKIENRVSLDGFSVSK